MGLAFDVGGGRLILGVQRVELLVEAMLGGDPGIDRAADRFYRGSLHDRASIADRSSLSRRPKNRGPFHLVPVIAKATLALQLFLPASSESMGNHDSDIV